MGLPFRQEILNNPLLIFDRFLCEANPVFNKQ